MSKFLTLFIAIFLTLNATSQNTLTFNFNGIITNADGTVQSGHTIFISSFFTDSTFIFAEAVSDQNGEYAIIVTALTDDVQGIINFSTMSCDASLLSVEIPWVLANQTDQPISVSADFIYCDVPFEETCSVFIVDNLFGNPLPYITAIVPSFPPNSPVEFIWSTGEAGATILPTAPGTYCVTATFSGMGTNAGCTATACYEFQNTPCSGYVQVIPLDITVFPPQFSLELIPITGTPPYTFQWSTGEDSQVLQEVPPGYYCVEVTDAEGCTYTECAEVFDINVDSCSVVIFEQITGMGSILTAFMSTSNPNENPQYVWSTGAAGNQIFPSEPGTYCVTATLDNCQASACYDYFPDSFSCFGIVSYFYDSDTIQNFNSYTATVQMIFGSAPYTYLWTTGDSTQTISGLEQGVYCVEVTDANGCIFTECVEIFDFNFCEVFIACDPDGKLQANAFGVEPFQYLWSTGDTTVSIIPIEIGDYCVTVTDATNCEVSSCQFFDPFPNIDSCFAFIIIGQDSLSPIGGADTSLISLTAFSFGTAPYTYLWSTGETTATIYAMPGNTDYCVTVTDADSCISTSCTNLFNGFCDVWLEIYYHDDVNAADLYVHSNSFSPIIDVIWSNGATGEQITVGASGNYCVTVMFENGCLAEACVWVDLDFTIDSCFAYIGVAQDPLEGGFILQAFSVGDVPLTYQWSNGATTQTILVDSLSTNICVTITHAMGCVYTACINDFNDYCQVIVDVEDSGTDSTLLLSAYNDPAFGPYSYVWSTGETTQSILVSDAGEYCVTVTSQIGCTSVGCTFAFPNPADSLSYTVSGNVYTNPNTIVQGKVFAYKIHISDFESDIYSLYDSTDIGPNGFYEFDSVPFGLYMYKAVLDENTDLAGQFFPTYYSSSLIWQHANLIFVPFFETMQTDIFMIPTDSTGGGGLISGSLIDPNGLVAESGVDPQRRSGGLAGINILLEHQIAGPFRYVKTDDEGHFNFENLPWGTYKIVFDYPGVTSPEIWVTLSPGNSEQGGVIISTNSISTDTDNEHLEDEIMLFPNPTKGLLNIDLGEFSGALDVEVMNMTGQLVEQMRSNINLGEIINVDMSTLPSGMYVIKLITDFGQSTKLVMRQ